MRICFVETMRGWMRAGQGPDFPVSFELRALHLQHGRFEVRGLLSAPPLTRETPTRGTLDLGLRALAYHLQFTGADGRDFTLEAVKRPSLLAPLRSMTRMQASIRDDGGVVVASGSMRFATGDLPAFLASWFPSERRPHRELDARRRKVERLAMSRAGEAP